MEQIIFQPLAGGSKRVVAGRTHEDRPGLTVLLHLPGRRKGGGSQQGVFLRLKGKTPSACWSVVVEDSTLVNELEVCDDERVCDTCVVTDRDWRQQ